MFRRQRNKVEYVPITIGDNRSHLERWNDVAYLDSVIPFGNNGVYKTEINSAIESLRLKADRAQTPDELKGCNYGIKILKDLLCIGKIARDKSDLLKLRSKTYNQV